jgi:uncharacterized protein (UPF0264 family)
MISVVNGNEALAAMEGGADIIDIKNPAEGPLGAPTPTMIEDVCTVLEKGKYFSIALGEFSGKSGAAALAALGSAYFNPDFVKIAFLPHHSSKEIRETLLTIKQSLQVRKHKTISLVAVAYADMLGDAPWDLNEFVRNAGEGGANGCLVDTWHKKNKSLLEYLSINNIESFVARCHQEKLFCGLAGSLSFSDVMRLCSLKPDILGVRSAVCGGDRLRGTVCPQSVQALKGQIVRSDFEGANKVRGSLRFLEEGLAFPDKNH